MNLVDPHQEMDELQEDESSPGRHERRDVMRRIILLAAAGLVGMSPVALPEVAAVGFSARVKLSVSGDEAARDRVAPALAAALMKLGDVVITHSEPSFTLNVVAKQIGPAQDGGIAISVVVTAPFPDIYADWISKPLRASWQTMAEPYTAILSHSLRMAAAGEVQKICQEIVTSFDAEQLEPARKPYREADEYLRKRSR